MSNADTPDRVRGTFPAQQLIATVPANTAATTVTLPANTAVLWVFALGVVVGTPLTVVGQSTFISYPVYEFAASDDDTNNRAQMAVVMQQVDGSVTLTWALAPTGVWYVVADAGPRVQIDPALASVVGPPAVAHPGWWLAVAGTDGANLRPLLTDNTGKLITSGGAFPPVYAARDAAFPADALLVGGSDGANLRALSVDATGHQLTIDQNLKQTIAATAAAVPADAVMVAGTDGANLRALLTDASGNQLTIDQNLKQTIAAEGAAIPADVVMIGGTASGVLRTLRLNTSLALVVADTTLDSAGSTPGAPVPVNALQITGTDGTNARALRTDKRGLPFVIPAIPNTATGDHPPIEVLTGSAIFAASGTLLAAAGAGKRYRIFSAQMTGPAGVTQSFLGDSIAGGAFAVGSGGSAASTTLPAQGVPMTTNAAVNYTLQAGAGSMLVVVIYTLETV